MCALSRPHESREAPRRTFAHEALRLSNQQLPQQSPSCTPRKRSPPRRRHNLLALPIPRISRPLSNGQSALPRNRTRPPLRIRSPLRIHRGRLPANPADAERRIRPSKSPRNHPSPRTTRRTLHPKNIRRRILRRNPLRRNKSANQSRSPKRPARIRTPSKMEPLPRRQRIHPRRLRRRDPPPPPRNSKQNGLRRKPPHNHSRNRSLPRHDRKTPPRRSSLGRPRQSLPSLPQPKVKSESEGAGSPFFSLPSPLLLCSHVLLCCFGFGMGEQRRRRCDV